MSELLEFLLELLDVISGLLEGWSDTLAVRIFLGAIPRGSWRLDLVGTSLTSFPSVKFPFLSSA